MSLWASIATALLLVATTEGQYAAPGAGTPVRSGTRGAYPPLDGYGNNQKNPAWGATNTPMIRYLVPDTAYVASNGTDGEISGPNRPSPREITLALTNSPYFKRSSRYNTSYLLSALGQSISQDIGRVGAEANSSNGGDMAIQIPPGDPAFASFNEEQQPLLQKSRKAISYVRSTFNRTRPSGPREQINTVSSFLDASSIYGQTPDVLRKIRAGIAGRLRDDGNRLLPLNVDDDTGRPRLQLKNVGGRVPQTQLRLSGNGNVNQNPFLLIMNNIWLREHNRQARIIENNHQDWEDEQIFQEARKWVIALFQQTALVDYMQGLGMPLPPYSGYNASLNPGVDNFFTTVAYRYGHATVNDVILRFDDNWNEHSTGHLPLGMTYYNPNVVFEGGLEPLIRGLVALPQAEVESRWVTSISGNLWHPGTINGTDLAAVNIMRGRDHGIPDYNTCRRLMGLQPYKTFQEITRDPEVAAILEQLYTTVNNIDAYVGGLAEPHYQHGHVGELFYKSIQDQFYRLREGDWWYYENTANGLFNDTEIQEIRSTGLREIIMRNTNITNLPRDIWIASGIDSGSCAAGADAAASGNGQQQQQISMLNGQAQLSVSQGSQAGWVKVLLTAAGQGWLGFGVAKPDTQTPMIGADIVLGTMMNGAPSVKRYVVSDTGDRSPPHEVPDNNRFNNARFEQSNGQVTLEFERPLAAGDANDGSNAISTVSDVTFIMARGGDNDFKSDMSYYHGRSNRDYVTVPKLFSGDGLTTSTSGAIFQSLQDAVTKRRAHGVLMGLTFMVVLPLGALAARQLRCHWLKSPGVRASLFYVHIATQVAGVAMTTAGFVIAVRTFGIRYDQVAYHHGVIGVAILVLIYSQLFMGFARPTASAPTIRRQLWDVAHSTLGRAAMLLGAVNVAIGVIIFHTFYGADLAIWGGLCVAGIACITLLQHILDRQEKYAVLKQEQEMTNALFGTKSGDVNMTPVDSQEYKDTHSHDGLASLPVQPPAEHSSSFGRFVGRLTESNLKRHHAAAAAQGRHDDVQDDDVGPAEHYLPPPQQQHGVYGFGDRGLNPDDVGFEDPGLEMGYVNGRQYRASGDGFGPGFGQNGNGPSDYPQVLNDSGGQIGPQRHG